MASTLDLLIMTGHFEILHRASAPPRIRYCKRIATCMKLSGIVEFVGIPLLVIKHADGKPVVYQTYMSIFCKIKIIPFKN